MICSVPEFPDLESWLTQFLRCLETGCEPPPPSTREEFLIADLHGVFGDRPYLIPNRRTLKFLGLPAWFGRHVEPLDELGREQFLRALKDDPEFRSACRCLLLEDDE